MNVILISHDYTPSIGGIASHVENIAKSLARIKYTVIVLSIRYNLKLPFKQKQDNLVIYRFLVPNISKIRGIFFIFFAAQFLFIYTFFKKIDVIHYHNILPDGIIAWFGFARTFIFTNHSSGFLEMFEHKKFIFFHRLLMKKANFIVCPSEELREKTIQYYRRAPSTVFFISNGVDIYDFSYVHEDKKRFYLQILKSRYTLDAGSFILFCPRRWEQKNGIEYFVRSLPFILKEIPNVIALFAGNFVEEEYTKMILKEIDYLGISRQVRILGQIQNSEMIPLYAVSDIVILPSLMEATSIAGLEAMACGIPVIGTEVGGIPFIVENEKTGYLVKQRNFQQIADKVLFLLRDSVLRKEMGVAARMVVEKKFTWNVLTNELVSIYQMNKNKT